MQKEKRISETETAFYLTVITMNILLLTIISGAVWAIYRTISDLNLLETVAYGDFY